MKPVISFITALFILTISVSGQNDYTVIKVNGTIMVKQRNVSLETGTVFSVKEDLDFKTDDATAAVINPQRGRLILTNRSHDLNAATTNYLPPMYNMASRGGSLNNNNDLTSHFSGRYVVLNRQKIVIDKKSFPMNNENFFFLRYQYKGEEINKKLEFSADTLIIDKKTLFAVDGNPIPSSDNTSIKLYYRKGKESLFISQFDLIFPDMNQLAKEISIILEQIKQKSTNEKIAEAGSFISEFYGTISKESLSEWLGVRFGIK
jgi:hypothetical protein